MSFFRRDKERSSSVPPNRRSQSFTIPNPQRDKFASKTDKLGESYHGRTEHQKGAVDLETVDDLNETILNLKSSLMTHATSNAETMEHFNTLQKAHDALYAEHVHLQEQMDDAVELLRYLKEEKSSNEETIGELQKELGEYKKMAQGSVVSMTIENMTKEKMELETTVRNITRIKDEAMLRAAALQSERDDFEQKAKSLEKFKEAYELQTKSSSNSGEKLSHLEKEKLELAERVTELEGEVYKLKQDADANAAMVTKMKDVEGELADVQASSQTEIADLKNEIRDLKAELVSAYSEQEMADEDKDNLIAELKGEVKELKAELVTAYSEQERADEQETEISDLRNKVKDMQSELDSEQERADKQEAIIEKLKHDLKEVKLEQAASSAHASGQQKTEIERLEAEIEDLEEELSAEAKKCTQYKLDVEKLHSKFNATNGMLAALEEELATEAEKSLRYKLQVNDLEKALEEKNKQIASIDEELVREKEEMQSHLDSLQRQLIQYQEEEGTPHHNSQQHPSQSSTENPQQQRPHEELMIENEELSYQVQNLQSQLKSERVKAAKEAEVHAQLEKEMQGRLAQRLAVHLQESEAAMEAKIRGELEEEFEEKMKNQQQKFEEKVKNQQRQMKAKSFNADAAKGLELTRSSSTSFQTELEDQLRKQLQQVKEERERWQSEQQEFQSRVLLSQQQLDKIREGYRKKYDKEKKKASDLEKANKDFEVVIEGDSNALFLVMISSRQNSCIVFTVSAFGTALHKELNFTKDELEELQARKSEQSQTLQAISNQKADSDWAKERKKLLDKEKEYQAEITKLQTEMRKLQSVGAGADRKSLEEEKSALVTKCKSIWEDHQTTLQG